LSRAPGSVSDKFDLELSVIASDPDDLTFSEFSYSWSCKEGASDCKGVDGNALLGQEKLENLEVLSANLKSGSYYNFIVTVKRTTPEKSGTAEVLLYINGKIKGKIFMPSVTGSLNNARPLLLKPTWEIDGIPEIKWTVSPSVNGLDTSQGYLYFEEFTLTEGGSYTIELALKASGDDDESATTASVSLYVNAPPICDSFEVTQNDNGKYVFSANRCYDVDSDSILIYQFGLYTQGIYLWLTRPVFSSSFKLRLPDGFDTAAYRVCDFDLSCSFGTREILPNSRLLYIPTDYNKDVEDIDETPSAIVYYSKSVQNNTDYQFLFEKLVSYFGSSELDDPTFDSLINTLKKLVENSIISGADISIEMKINTTEFMNTMILKYGQQITQQIFSDITTIFSYMMPAYDAETISEYLNLYGKYALKGSAYKTIGSTENNYSRTRTDSSKLTEGEFSAGSKMSVKFPVDLYEQNSDENGTSAAETYSIYDITVSSYSDQREIFEVTFKKTGNNKNGLELFGLDEENDVKIKSKEGIEIRVKGTYDTSKSYKCVYLVGNNTWDSAGCRIGENDGENITLITEHLSSFSIEESNGDDDDDCKVGAGPVATMSVLIFMILFCGLILKLADREVTRNPNVNSFLLLYPLTSLFFKQNMMRRSVIIIQILTTELLMLALIGAFHYHWDETNDDSDNSFSNFYGRQLRRGAAGWALTQAFTIPIFLLNGYMLEGKKYHYITLPVCLFFILGSFVGIIVMTVYYCKAWTEYWITNWLIFLLFDIATLEILYALILSSFIKISQPKEEIGRVENKKRSEILVTSGPTPRDVEASFSCSSSYDIISDANLRNPEEP
jgi:hypothetical protein